MERYGQLKGNYPVGLGMTTQSASKSEGSIVLAALMTKTHREVTCSLPFDEQRFQIGADLFGVVIVHIPINSALDSFAEQDARLPIKKFFRELVARDSIIRPRWHVGQKFKRNIDVHMP